MALLPKSSRALGLGVFLAVVISQVLSSTVHAQSAAKDVAAKEPITFDHVYGEKRLSLGGGPPQRLTWIDDESYVQREGDGWVKVSAKSGEKSAWYDAGKLADALKTQANIEAEEAKKLAAGGWLEFSAKKRLAVFRSKDRLIRMTLDGTDCAIVTGVPENIELTAFSPSGHALGFVKSDELWVADFAKSELRQLTHDAGPSIRNGKADWVYFEEVYNRSWLAWRWSPDGQQIAYQQFNDTAVPKFQISDHTTVQQSIEIEHYPKAGETNPIVRLGVVSASGGPTRWISTASYEPQDFILAHFNWLPDGSAVYWFAQNRIQTWLDVLVADLSTGESRKVLRDQTEAWVDNPGDITFLKDGSFLLFSERTGWKHLYHVAKDGQMTALTSGEWEARDLLAVSEDETSVLVAGTKNSPIAETICRVSLSKPGSDVQVLTPEPGQHSASVSLHGSWFADSASSLTKPVKVTMRDGNGKEVRVLSEAPGLPVDKYQFGAVEMRDLPMADGSTTKGILVLPPGFDPSKKYPVWLKTYAGPHAPQVRDSWNPRLADHMLANLGIVVITFDPRSASGYSAKSAWLCYRKLCVEETKDLVSVCDWLKAQSWADTTKIGLNGHSYGGYFTAYVMTHTDRISAGISGAPVTDWAHYDSIYTERFMSTPQDNPEGYKASSVVAAASNLKGRLLILHGLKDDNVHPENTIQLMHALQNAGRQFEVMFYPTARHGIFGQHYSTLMYNFMVESMGKPEAKR